MVAAVARNVMVIVEEGSKNMECIESVIEGLKKCRCDRSDTSNPKLEESRCWNCKYTDCKDVTLTCRKLLVDARTILESFEDDSIFRIPKVHIDNVLSKYELHIERLQVCEEECSELIKAISKHIRSLQNNTTISKDEARKMIVEECTHVAISLCMLRSLFDIKQEEIDAEILRKAEEDNFDLSKYSIRKVDCGKCSEESEESEQAPTNKNGKNKDELPVGTLVRVTFSDNTFSREITLEDVDGSHDFVTLRVLPFFDIKKSGEIEYRDNKFIYTFLPTARAGCGIFVYGGKKQIDE